MIDIDTRPGLKGLLRGSGPSALVLLLCALLPTVGAQTTLHTFPGQGISDFQGWSVASAGTFGLLSGNVSGIVTGAPGATISSTYGGRVQVHAGITGSLLFSMNGAIVSTPGGPVGEALGSSVVGRIDANSDGVQDIVVGAPSFATSAGYLPGRVLVISGVVPHPIIRTHGGGAAANNFGGSSVATVGDLDGDGFDDYAYGLPGRDTSSGVDSGRVRVISARTGNVIHANDGGQAYEQLGRGLAAVGDVNGDTVPDYAAYGFLTNAGSSQFSGIVRVYSGATGTQLWTRSGNPGTLDQFGAGLAGGIDFNGDGRDEVLIGAPLDGTSGRVYIADGVTGQNLLPPLVSTSNPGATPPPNFGRSISAGKDLDADGIGDLVIGELGTDSVLIYSGNQSGASPALRARLNGPTLSWFGASSALLDDANADGVPEFVVGAYTDAGGTGSATVYSSGFYGAPCGGSLFQAPTLTVTGNVLPAGPVTIDCTQGTPGAQAYLLVGTQPTFAPQPWGCAFLVIPAIAPTFIGNFDANGDLSLPNLPIGGLTPPATFFLQVIGVQGSQMSATSGYRLVFP